MSDVTLPPDLQAFAERKASAQGAAVSDYLIDLVRRDQERDKLRGLIYEGLESARFGTADEAYFDALRELARPQK